MLKKLISLFVLFDHFGLTERGIRRLSALRYFSLKTKSEFRPGSFLSFHKFHHLFLLFHESSLHFFDLERLLGLLWDADDLFKDFGKRG